MLQTLSRRYLIALLILSEVKKSEKKKRVKYEVTGRILSLQRMNLN